MLSLKNKIVVVTGASSGIGKACAYTFAQQGARLILAARRMAQLQLLSQALKSEFGTDCHLLELDVRDRTKVEATFSSLPIEWQTIDVLINNAGLSRGLDKLYEGNVNDWEEMIDTNVKGLLYVTRTIVPDMVRRNSGHVINLGSIAGHETYPKGNVYCATKAAVRSITEGLKQDVLGTAVRVSTVDPGLVETEFSQVRFHGDTERAKTIYQDTVPLTAEDIADVVLFCASRAPHVNISEVIVLPTAQSSATLVHRT